MKQKNGMPLAQAAADKERETAEERYGEQI